MMKKQLLKVTLLALAVFLGTTTVNAQEEWVGNGVYQIRANGTTLVWTVNPGDGAVTWETALPDTDPDHQYQEFAITDHGAPSSTGHMQITGSFEDNVGPFVVTLATLDPQGASSTTIKANFADPITDSGSVDYGLDQFQRRKATPNNGSNNAIFMQVGNGSLVGYRYTSGDAPSAAGDPVTMAKSGAHIIMEYVFVEDLPSASVNTFELGAFTIANPIGDQLVIKGATADVSKVSVFSIVGSNVLSQSINVGGGDIELNVNNLPSGLYVVEILGNNGERFTQKLVKN